jgi:hypothetical protein
MIPFLMKVVCYQCHDSGQEDYNFIEFDPPIYVSPEGLRSVCEPRLEIVIERFPGWIVINDNPFCCRKCYEDYLENLRSQEKADRARDGE